MFDTEGTMEEYMDTYYHGVFNTDYVANTATYTSPEMNRDVSSELQVCIVIRANKRHKFITPSSLDEVTGFNLLTDLEFVKHNKH